jgi:molybdopterin converting factor small subunit
MIVNDEIRPAEVCRALLMALEAADGRRKSRKRDQTADTIGIAVKRALLSRAVDEDPDPNSFEEWLLQYPSTCAEHALIGPARAMARAVYDEWKLAQTLPEFRSWLELGAPSEDADGGPRRHAPTVEDVQAPDPVRCRVEFFGAARLVAHKSELALTLRNGATLADACAALCRELPALAGRVIARDGNGFVEGYACNLNGADFVRAFDTPIRSGDSILILAADAGG